MTPPLADPLPPCGPKNTLGEAELRAAGARGAITAIDVIELDDGALYYVLVTIRARVRTRWYFATKRDQRAPRTFVDLWRLTVLLAEIAPTVSLMVHRGGVLPEPAKD